MSTTNKPRYALLGPVEALVHDQVIRIPRPRQRSVLAYLLLCANKVVSVDELIEALWNGAEPGTARTQIQSDISALRRAYRAARAEPPVHTRGSGYLIQVDDDQLDTEIFRQLVAQARHEQRDGNWKAGLRLVRTGLALWRGLPLTDVTAGFAESARRELLELKLSADELVVDCHLAHGDDKSAIAALTPLVAAHPLHEELRRKLMLALFRDGRRTEALRQARDLRTELADQQGLTPGRPFLDLEEAILRGAPARQVERPAPIPAQLPREQPDFTGRDDCLSTLDRLAFSDVGSAQRTTIIALVGSAGVGKTALALHWAHHVADRFPDGQLYLDLRGYSQESTMTGVEALARMLSSLGVAAEAVPDDLAECATLFRSIVADRRMLVILDNVSSAGQVRPLLSANADTLTLVTSRSKLTGLAAREGARRVTVRMLAPAEGTALLNRILGAERLRVEPAHAAALVRACVGLPLALRIAAANITNHPAAGIDDYVRELTAGDVLSALHATGDEETSVRAAFDQSYRTVSRQARRCFRLLSHLPGPAFSLEAIRALTDIDPPELRQVLDELVEAHLVDETAAGHYTMHDLLRSYARSRAELEAHPAGARQPGHCGRGRNPIRTR